MALQTFKRPTEGRRLIGCRWTNLNQNRKLTNVLQTAGKPPVSGRIGPGLGLQQESAVGGGRKSPSCSGEIPGAIPGFQGTSNDTTCSFTAATKQ